MHDASFLDAGIITAAQRFEHHEIAAYGSGIPFARKLNRNEVASLLQELVFLGIATFSFAWIARDLLREGPPRVPDRAVP